MLNSGFIIVWFMGTRGEAGLWGLGRFPGRLLSCDGKQLMGQLEEAAGHAGGRGRRKGGATVAKRPTHHTSRCHMGSRMGVGPYMGVRFISLSPYPFPSFLLSSFLLLLFLPSLPLMPSPLFYSPLFPPKLPLMFPYSVAVWPPPERRVKAYDPLCRHVDASFTYFDVLKLFRCMRFCFCTSLRCGAYGTCAMAYYDY